MRVILSCLFLVFAVQLSMAQQPFRQHVWLNEARIAEKANTLCLDAAGRLLIGSNNGVIRYNGSKCTRLKADSLVVMAMCKYQGGVWFATEGGQLGTVEADSLRVRMQLPLKDVSVNDIIFSPSGRLLVCTNEGLMMLGFRGWTIINQEGGLSDNYVYTARFNDDGSVIAATDQGLNMIYPTGMQPVILNIGFREGLTDNIVRVVEPVKNSGNFLLGTHEQGIAIYSAATGRIVPLAMENGWQWGAVNDILQVEEGRFWVACESGFVLSVCLEMNKVKSYEVVELAESGIYDLIGEPSGNIFAATGRGLTQLTGTQLSVVTPDSHHVSEPVTALMVDDHGHLWQAKHRELWVGDLQATGRQSRKIWVAPTIINTLAKTPGGNLLIGTAGSGVWCLFDNSTMPVPLNHSVINSGHILSLAIAGNHLFVAGLNGVQEFLLPSGQRQLRWLKTHNKKSGVGSDYVYQLYTDSRQRVWMATDGAGVCMYDGRQYHHWQEFSQSEFKVVYSLAEDSKGRIWAGLFGGTILRLEQSKWKAVLKHVKHDFGTGFSALINGKRGSVVAISQNEIKIWLDEPGSFRSTNTRTDLGIDSMSIYLNCFARDRAGIVYLPTSNGLLRIDPDIYNNTTLPALRINSISSNNGTSPPEVSSFPSLVNYLHFSFESINYNSTAPVSYRYQLQGLSDQWVYTTEPSAIFAGISPGNYILRIQSGDGRDYNEHSEVLFSFQIAQPFWKSWWFLVLAFSALAGLGYLLVYMRDRRIRRVALLQQEKLAFEYDSLKTQINPHFLFNSLNTLTALIEDDPRSAVLYTERFSDMYRHILSYNQVDLIVISEELKILDDYLFIQQSRFGPALKVVVDMPEQIGGRKKIPPMALQFLVENAIKHNVVSMASPLIIFIKVEGEELIVSNRIKVKHRKEPGTQVGLININNRYRLLVKKQITFGIVGDDWVVRLPLLD